MGDGMLRAPLPAEPLIWAGNRCIRCGLISQGWAGRVGGKCPLIEGSSTRYPHEWERVRLEVTVLNNEALRARDGTSKFDLVEDEDGERYLQSRDT